MAKDSLQDDVLHPTNSPSDTSQVPLLLSASKASESELSAHAGGKRKRSVKGKDGRKSEKQKKQKKIRTFVVSDDDEDDEDDEDKDDEDEDDNDDNDEEGSDKEKAGNDDDKSGSGGELATRHSNRLKTLKLNTITPSEERPTLTDMPMVAARDGCHLIQSAQLDQSVPRSPLAPHGTPPSSPTRTPLGHGPAPPSQPTTPLPVPTLFPQPSIQPSPRLVTPQTPPKLPLPLDSSWPTWFQKAYTGLSSIYLSAELTSAIRIYVDFEKTANFVVGSPNAGFKVDNRPPEVAYWVGRGRKSAPPIKDLASFEAGWWNWWKGLQPIWRSVVEVEGPLTATHREVTDGEGGWAGVDRHGQNAFLTVLSCLVWWGTALNGCQGESESWTAAVADVHWVLTNLVR
jgi:hypothetical protein